MRHIPDLATLRQAGAKRARRAIELIDYLNGDMSLNERVALHNALGTPSKDRLGLLPIVGGSEQIIQLTASPAALGAALATYIGPLVGLPESPLVLGLQMCPTITGATAAATLTFNMRRTDTPAVISSLSFLTATADTNPRGPTLVGVVPFGIPAVNGIDCQASASAGAGTLTATATAPLILAAIGLN